MKMIDKSNKRIKKIIIHTEVVIKVNKWAMEKRNSNPI